MALGLAALMAAPVCAQTQDTGPSWWRPFVGVGYTWGGKTIYPGRIQIIGTSTVYDEDVSAGAGLDLRTGLQLRPGGGPLTIKGVIAYHTDGQSGLDGWTNFHRMPVELGLGYAINERWNIGAGARKSLRPQLRRHKDNYEISTSPSVTVNYDYRETMSAKTGYYIETEWLMTPSLALQARLVHETFRVEKISYENSGGLSYTYEANGNGPTYGADHFGLMLVYYFR
jgi:hypothetical protein